MTNIVTDYGAVADASYARAVFTISLGSPNLSSTTALWSSGDVGKNIVVGGAGASGNPLQTTILSFTDSQHIVLNTNALTALSSYTGIVSWATTNNATAFANYNAAMQGATDTLTIPAGTYLISAGNQSLFDGISNLTVNATGATLTGGIFDICPGGMHQDNTHQARTQQANAGSNSVTLITPSQTSLFTVGQWALMTGLDMQGAGFPTNQFYFDYVLVSAINAGTGVITFTNTLTHTYLTTWPFNNGGGAFAPDYGGPATIYALRSQFNATFVFNGLTIAQDLPRILSGLDMTFNSCTCVAANGMFPTLAKSVVMSGCDWSNCGVEADKMVDTWSVTNGTNIATISFQSSSFNLF